MAISKKQKTRTVVHDDVEDVPPVQVEEVPDDTPASVQPVPAPKVRQAAKSTFTAVLREASTYEVGNLIFRRDVPTEVDRKYLDELRSNGFFSVIE